MLKVLRVMRIISMRIMEYLIEGIHKIIVVLLP